MKQRKGREKLVLPSHRNWDVSCQTKLIPPHNVDNQACTIQLKAP